MATAAIACATRWTNNGRTSRQWKHSNDESTPLEWCQQWTLTAAAAAAAETRSTASGLLRHCQQQQHQQRNYRCKEQRCQSRRASRTDRKDEHGVGDAPNLRLTAECQCCCCSSRCTARHGTPLRAPNLAGGTALRRNWIASGSVTNIRLGDGPTSVDALAAHERHSGQPSHSPVVQSRASGSARPAAPRPTGPTKQRRFRQRR